jgi:hypothetical protein
MTIYMIAVAVGFTDEVAYFFSAFSQAIDYNQYRGVDACGRDMPPQWWTPRMRGLSRLNTFDGGTVRHLGGTYVGILDEAPIPEGVIKGYNPAKQLHHFNKTYTGNSAAGCRALDFKQPFDSYLPDCPSLRLDLEDKFYNGILWQGRRWALNDSRTLCVSGYTVMNSPTDSPFEGDTCLPGRVQKLVNIDLSMTQGPIPLNNYYFISGIQQVDYDCSPDCFSPNYSKSNIVYVTEFEEWLKTESEVNGYAKMRNGESVDPVVAKFGVYLHWLVDKASHWYCTDASKSGHTIVFDEEKPGEYEVYCYLDNIECHYLTHMMSHYWEQGLTGMTPSSYAALVLQYKELLNFREKFIDARPDWFRWPVKAPMNFRRIIGDYENPGDLFEINQISDPVERYQACADWLEKKNLPPIPGFESQTC